MTSKRKFRNRLNELSTKEWLQFQKSWFIHRAPPRRKDVLLHPAKFPETLAGEFIKFFTKSRQWVLDPMIGTGSTAVAALRAGRHSVGIELNPRYVRIAREVIQDERLALGERAARLEAKILAGDAAGLADLDLPVIDYVLTSPPYWDMLHARGAETQRERRGEPDLDVVYSDHPADLGNIRDYDEFLERLIAIYARLAMVLRPGAYITIIVKNIKKGGKIYPLAWDLGKGLAPYFTLKDERIWCQDDARLAPYGMGNAWVSNTVHHYCLQFRNEACCRV
jgi:DNA modification methylase